MKARFLDLLHLRSRWIDDAGKEFIVEFFEVACETRDVLNLEINGRGLYDCMQLLRPKM
jgi:hypothetical protein